MTEAQQVFYGFSTFIVVLLLATWLGLPKSLRWAKWLATVGCAACEVYLILKTGVMS